ncbi:MAG: pirin family protein [Clostridiales bacterium]|nr:pirin family protein [Clostridiales bacterium]MDY4061024.1 pirin family protein [Anaerovoracaceae bacterium]
MNRKVEITRTGRRTVDGAGVNLVRVLGDDTAEEFDPILMLDSFDSMDPSEYIAGFPLHPHRGIETISYLSKGKMKHKDSIGNEDTITDGEVQWMNSGSGITHAEELPATDRMLGVQLWLNLPRAEKLSSPYYYRVSKSDIEEIPFDGGFVRLLAGSYDNHKGFSGEHLPLDYYDIHLAPNATFTIDTKQDSSIMLFTLIGEINIEGEKISEKTAVKLGEGDKLVINNRDRDSQVLFISSKKLGEPIAWAGPIVMNTKEELKEAFDDLDRGTFIKEKMNYGN